MGSTDKKALTFKFLTMYLGIDELSDLTTI